ncbi:MAG: radical SAM protein [Bacteroidales bacterium]|nr:radical SAM protein [Bacteroidales bacterium]
MNKNILLINPPQENTLQAGIEDDFVDIIGYYPPLGLMYMATMLKNNGYDVKILDCVPMNIRYDKIKSIVADFQPFAVGISTFTMSMIDVLNTAKVVKDISSNIHVILGGHHTLLYPKQSVKYSNVDYILIGEADYTFPQLLNALENDFSDEEILKIQGVGFYRNGVEKINYSRAIVENLDDLPFPDRSMLPMEIYQSIVGRNKMVATVMSSRGCPFKCTYCYTPSKKYRSRSTENIMQEVRYLISLGYKEIFFFDDLFALKPEKVIEFAKALVVENIKIDWSFRGRINAVTEEMIYEVKKAGIHRIQFGIESGVDKTLKRVKKGITTEQIINVIKWCKKAKITTIGNFMIGLPDETEADINETLKFSRKIGLNYSQYSILVPYPFTEIYTEAMQKGLFSKDYWLEFSNDPYGTYKNFKVEYWTETVSEEFLFKTIKQSFKRFYFRPITILNKLREIRTLREFWFAVRGALDVFKFNPKVKTIKGQN